VHGHFTPPHPWLTIDETVHEMVARLVGAKLIVCNLLAILCTVVFGRGKTERERERQKETERKRELLERTHMQRRFQDV
jgi:hypothetical protein